MTLTLLHTEIGVLFGLLDDDGATLLHIVVPKMEFVHKIFSDSAFGDDTSTCVWYHEFDNVLNQI